MDKVGVNTKNLRHLAMRIRTAAAFSQRVWVWEDRSGVSEAPYTVDFTCATPGCVAGHAGVELAQMGSIPPWMTWIDVLIEYTGLSQDFASAICEPVWFSADLVHYLELPLDSLPGSLKDLCGTPTRYEAAELLYFLADHYDRVQGGAS